MLSRVQLYACCIYKVVNEPLKKFTPSLIVDAVRLYPTGHAEKDVPMPACATDVVSISKSILDSRQPYMNISIMLDSTAEETETAAVCSVWQDKNIPLAVVMAAADKLIATSFRL